MPAPLSKSKSPLAWERAWQKELDVVYVKASIAQLKSVGKEGQRLATSSSLSTEPSISVFQFNHPTLCRLQQDLLDLAAEKCVVDNFEDKWRAAGPKEREKHYFEAMKRVCRMPDMEKQRRYAPEISLSGFQAGNGQGYLDLLRSLMPEQIPPNQYVRIDNPAVNAQFGIQGPVETVYTVPKDPQVLLQRLLDVFRGLFMSLVVWHTLLSFYNRSERTIPVRSGFKPDRKQILDQLTELEGGGTSQVTDILLKEDKQARKQGQWVCAYCRKPEESTEDGLKSCIKCKAIQRCVMYCNRDCQLKDWKNGNPPHKITCGKPASDIPTPSLPTSTSPGSIPPKSCTYRRSIALVHQMSMLEKNPSVDYVLIPPAPLPDIGAALAEPKLAQLFRLLRHRAFETGDKECVYLMYKMLKDIAKSRTEYGLSGLEKQLGAEFRMDAKEFQENTSTGER